jgi:hypothetical protein
MNQEENILETVRADCPNEKHWVFLAVGETLINVDDFFRKVCRRKFRC